MARAKLDRIDRRILSDLQSNGRMTNVELAERAGISAPPCLRRVRALERAGIQVTERIPCEVPLSEYAEEYLKTKKQKMGHLFTSR